MTDERQEEDLWPALQRLPRGAGIVFRHYGLQPKQRRALFERVKRQARRRGLLLLLAGPARLARALGADGSHDTRRGPGLLSAPAHSLRQIRAAEAAGAGFVFLSPIFPTRSHPAGRTLGRIRFGLAANQARVPVIALGGIEASRARSVEALGAYGWAAIDAWSRNQGSTLATNQKRKAVPT
jgi:thiamine-phosphate pyrophosphorylase